MELSVKPEDWFLKDRGNPDSEIALYTKGNRVEALVDGSAYMAKLHELLTSMEGPEDFFYYAGWQLNLGLKLIPEDDESTVEKVFTKAHSKNVDVRLLLSGHVTNKNNPADKTFRKLKGETSVQCVLDSRFRSLGSAHQKFSVLFTDRANGSPDQRLPSKRLHALCGGIDLAFDRWDDSYHSYAISDLSLNSDDPEPIDTTRLFRQFKDYNGGWHDVHAYIEGPACIDLYLTFLERWNNPNSPLSWKRGIATQIPTRDLTQAFPEVGTHFVQILRTYSCGYKVLRIDPQTSESYEDLVSYPFASSGEFSARMACLHAISMVQYYIYIEDQYFFSSEIAVALKNAMNNKPDLRVIVLVAHEPKADQVTILENHYHANAVEFLKSETEQGRFAIYDLFSTVSTKKPEQIYVHAKLMIIDDIWVEMGSMNCNRRSMTYDMEAAIAVVDSETQTVTWGDPPTTYKVCKFARELRLRLWAEHLGISSTENPVIQDPHKGFEEWKKRTNPKDLYLCHARRHDPTHLSRKASARLWNDLVDPQGTCPGAVRIPAP